MTAKIIPLYRDPERVVDEAILRRMRRQRHVREALERRRRQRENRQ